MDSMAIEVGPAELKLPETKRQLRLLAEELPEIVEVVLRNLVQEIIGGRVIVPKETRKINKK